MRAVIPAAGAGTRLRPLTADRPKALVDVAGRPLLSYVFDAAIPLGVTEFVVVVGYRAGAIVDRFGDAYDGVPVQYVHQRERRGLGHAVLQAAPHIEDDFLVINGDNAIDADLSPLVEHHADRRPAATVPLERVSAETARETGVAVVEDSAVRAVVEKSDDPPSRLAMTGMWAFSPAIFDACRLAAPAERGEVELATAIDLLARAGRQVDAVSFPGWRLNVNTPADVEVATRRLREG